MMNRRHKVKKIMERIRSKVPPNTSSSSSPNSNHVSSCCSTQFLIQNRGNFQRSGAPYRFLFYRGGSWVDLLGEVVESLRLGFVEGKPVVEVLMDGSRCLFDFLRMLWIDLGTGGQRSIAWIDVKGKCFFPKVFVEEEFRIVSENPKLEITIRIEENSDKRKREVLKSEQQEGTEGSCSNSPKNVLKRQRAIAEDLGVCRWPNVRLLKKGESAHSTFERLFSDRMRLVEPSATVTAIYQCSRTGLMEKARAEVFQKQMDITKSARGTSNVSFAWHGTTAEGVASILTHGFGINNKGPGHGGYGVGIYLNPVGLPHVSALVSEADVNGEKHVVFCRVILGNVEKIEAGSKQFCPSDVNCDTGVDDIKNPKWYVVWYANMSSHILPEFVVSYKSSDHFPGQHSGLGCMKWIPNVSNSSIVKLFSKLESSLPSEKVKALETLCISYKAGVLAKDSFVKQLRSIAGEKMLFSTIHEIRSSE